MEGSTTETKLKNTRRPNASPEIHLDGIYTLFKGEESTSKSVLNTLSRRTIYSNFDFGLKNSSFRLPYQHHSSSHDCARQLFKGSNGLASLLVHTRKNNFLVGGCGFFVSDIICEVVLGSFWLMLPGLGPNRYAKVIRWSFHWKLGSRPSLLSLWSAFQRFWLKSYDLK